MSSQSLPRILGARRPHILSRNPDDRIERDCTFAISVERSRHLSSVTPASYRDDRETGIVSSQSRPSALGTHGPQSSHSIRENGTVCSRSHSSVLENPPTHNRHHATFALAVRCARLDTRQPSRPARPRDPPVHYHDATPPTRTCHVSAYPHEDTVTRTISTARRLSTVYCVPPHKLYIQLYLNKSIVVLPSQARFI